MLRIGFFQKVASRIAATFLIAVVLVCTGTSQPARAGADPVLSIPDYVHLSHYTVSGFSSAEIVEHIASSGPVDLSGNRRAALTKWSFTPQWHRLPNGLIEPSRSSITPAYTIVLPKWQAGPGSLAEPPDFWSAYFDAIVIHELNHLSNAQSCVQRLENLLRNWHSPLGAEEKIILHEFRKILLQCSRKDIAYDRATRNGELEGVVLHRR
ncbi:MAG: DUF922 domain-containing protein [Deltaproteobacteria bacterium]|nr:DUF922 domain-containing protein [Deltaproteobacteria bacterium]